VDPGTITQQLLAAREGGRAERDRLLESVYSQLKQIAVNSLRGGRGSATLDATDLLHETYLRLVNQTQADWRDRGHFFAVAARAMRQIAVDHARRRHALKRGGPGRAETLDEAHASFTPSPEDVLDIDAALRRLEALSPRLVEVVELCFFAGMTTEEAAAALDVSPRTVKRDWQKARTLLYALIHGPVPPPIACSEGDRRSR
jgi:RNA polymerase sigma factor (TIGR02999 family)